MFANIYVCENHVWMHCMAILENQSLRYLNFNYERKVLNYALKQDIWRVLLLLVNIFLKLTKWKRDFPLSLPNWVHYKWIKNVMSLRTNMIQPIITNYYINVVINHYIVPFYFASNHKYYFSVLLHFLRYLHKTC